MASLHDYVLGLIAAEDGPDSNNESIPPSGHVCKKQVKHFTRTAKGTKEVLPSLEHKLFRTKVEGRAKQVVSPRVKKIPLKTTIWSSSQILRFFQQHQIHPLKTKWFVHFNTPHRKMTCEDFVELTLQYQTFHRVHSNMNYKHFIIESLKGEE